MKTAFLIRLLVVLTPFVRSDLTMGDVQQPIESVKTAAPDFGPNVLVFDPSMATIQQRIDAVFVEQEKSQFGSGRYALLFKPGKYDLDVQVGFYTHVAGLGRVPDDVEITGAVRAKAAWMKGNATCNFWRCAENLSVVPTKDEHVNVWAVSQGVAMRRLHVKGNLALSDGGWSSGGFLADCKIDGRVDSGSQQQWMSRNCEWSSWRGGNWNMVFVGTINPPAGEWPEHPYTVIEQTPVIREKPYLFVDGDGSYSVMVPELKTRGTKGTTWAGGLSAAASGGTPIPIDRFFIARADRDTAATINAAIEGGKHLLLTPGIYHLEKALRITRPDTVVLGLGYPTLSPDPGIPAMVVSDVDGAVVSGVLFEAAEAGSPTLLEVGVRGSSRSHAANPICLHDIFCRAGGAVAGQAECFVRVFSSDVVGDNLWLWRADHGAGAKWEVNKNKNGLIVDGRDVTMYGLFVEHCHEYQTIWNGDGGRVYFYQSEMPYDPPSEAGWSHDGVTGYASYKVAEVVKTHEAWGLGVYCVFRASPLVAHTAIEAPEVPGVKLHNMVTIRLDGLPGSGIGHVINARGEGVLTPAKKKAQVK